MTLPVLQKTWQFNVNQALPAQASTLIVGQKAMFAIVQALLGFGSNAWTIVGSSDSSTAGIDAVNRWTDSTKLFWANGGVAHSWIVLKQAGIATNFQLCIDLGGNGTGDSHYASVYVSYAAGFTGGSTTAHPTATDQVVIMDATVNNPAGTHQIWWHSGFGAATAAVLHAVMSSDGQCTRVFIQQGNITYAWFLFDKPKNPISGWTTPWVGTWYSTDTAVSSANQAPMSKYLTSGPSAGVGYGHFSNAALVGTCGWTCEGCSLLHGFTAMPDLHIFLNDISASYPLLPLGLYSESASLRGQHGEFFDLWFGPSSGANPNDTYPADASRQFVQFGNVVHAWNGSVVVTA